MTTEKALREALENSTEMLRHCRCLNEEGAVAEQVSENRAALSLPETQGKPVNFPDSIYSPFNSCVFKSQCIQREEEQDAPPSQPAQGEAATEKLQKLDAIIQETRDFLDMVEMLSEEPDLDRSDTLRLLGVLNDYRAMLAAAPATPTQACRSDGRCQYAIDHGAEGLGHCPVGKCAMQAKPTNGEGA